MSESPVPRPRPTPVPAVRPTARPKIEAVRLSAWYGDTHVLRSVSLEVPEHSVLAVIGPSGCGKTTFIRCLNRMHELSPGARQSGQLRVDGRDLHGGDVDPVELRRRVGMVFQRPNPFPTHSICDNVAAGLKLNGIPGRPERVEQSLRRAALWDEVKDRLHESALSLSGGQQQRLCIARALAVEPEVLLMDEPASALDPIATAKIEELIHELKAQLHHRHRHPQHAAGGAGLGRRRPSSTWASWSSTGPTEQIFTNPQEPRTEDYVTGKFG